MLSNAYFLAKFRFDTAENEPAKKFAKFGRACQKFTQFWKKIANFANLLMNRRQHLPDVACRTVARDGRRRAEQEDDEDATDAQHAKEVPGSKR